MARHSDDTVEIICSSIGHETAKALLIEVPDPDDPTKEISHWIPFSQIYEIHKSQNKIVVSKWIAEKKDLI